jgi:hypothetical protein
LEGSPVTNPHSPQKEYRFPSWKPEAVGSMVKMKEFVDDTATIPVAADGSMRFVAKASDALAPPSSPPLGGAVLEVCC